MWTSRTLAAAAVAAALSVTPPPAAGQASACDGPAHRAFDFWVGDWEVRNPEGEVVGHNTIRTVSGGCALLESWTSAGGSTGTSLSYYDPEADRWTQVWVGEGGLRLRLVGGLREEEMVLRSRATRQVDGEAVLDRITWTPLTGERVRQTWETSADGGESWEVYWRGTYRAAGGG